jgi:hypothetical protein
MWIAAARFSLPGFGPKSARDQDARTPEKYRNDTKSSQARDPHQLRLKAGRRHQTPSGPRVETRRSWLIPGDLLARVTSAGDEGGRRSHHPHGAQAQALGNHRTRTRTVSMVWLASEARLFTSRDAGSPPAARLPRSR